MIKGTKGELVRESTVANFATVQNDDDSLLTIAPPARAAFLSVKHDNTAQDIPKENYRFYPYS